MEQEEAYESTLSFPLNKRLSEEELDNISKKRKTAGETDKNLSLESLNQESLEKETIDLEDLDGPSTINIPDNEKESISPVVKNSSLLHCYFCDSIFSAKNAFVEHLSKPENNCIAPTFLKQSIVDGKTSFNCILCGVSSTRVYNIIAHTQGKWHKFGVQAGKMRTEAESLTKDKCITITKFVQEISEQDSNLISEKTGTNESTNPSLFLDSLKQEPLASKTLDSEVSNVEIDCSKNLEDDLNVPKNDSESIPLVVKDSPNFCCYFCDSIFSTKDTFVKHLSEPANNCIAPTFLKQSILDEKLYFDCILCGVYSLDKYDIISHTQGKWHKALNLAERRRKQTEAQTRDNSCSTSSISMTQKISEQEPNQILEKGGTNELTNRTLPLNSMKQEPLASEILDCELSNVVVSCEKNIEGQEQRHADNLHELSTIVSKNESKSVSSVIKDYSRLYCYFCDSSFLAEHAILEHFSKPLNNCIAPTFLKQSILDEKSYFSCFLCDIYTHAVANIIAHTQGDWHKFEAQAERKRMLTESLTKDESCSKYGMITIRVQDLRSNISVTNKISEQDSNLISEKEGTSSTLLETLKQEPLESEILDCELSNLEVSCEKNIENYQQEQRHAENLHELSTIIVPKNENESISPIIKNSSRLYCYFCESSFQTENSIIEHFSMPANSCIAPTILKQSIVNEKLYFDCILCGVYSLNECDIISHTQEEWHRTLDLAQRMKTQTESLTIDKSLQNDHLPTSSISVIDKISEQKSNLISQKEGTNESTSPTLLETFKQEPLELETLNCELSNVEVGCEKNLEDHQQERRHEENLHELATITVPKNKSKSIPQVVKDSFHLNCYFCDASFLTENALIEHFSKPFNSCPAPSFLEKFVLNGKSYFDCILCNILSLNTYDIVSHTQGMRHKTAALARRKIEEESITKDKTSSKCFQDICESTSGISVTKKISEEVPKHISKKRKTEGSTDQTIDSLMQEQLLTNSLECELCNVKVGNKMSLEQHLKGKRHLDNLRRSTTTVSKNEKESIPSVKKDFWFMQCYFCDNVYLKENAFVKHFSKPTNICIASSFMKKYLLNEKSYFDCILCDIYSLDINNMISHTQGIKHESAVLEKKKKIQVTKNKSSSKYVQEVCVLSSSTSVTQKISEHKSNQILGNGKTERSNNQISDLDSSTQNQLAIETLNCKICNIKLGCKQNVLEHLKGRRHLDNLRGLSITTVSKNERESIPPVKKNSSLMHCYFCDSIFTALNAFVEHFSVPTNDCIASTFLKQFIHNKKSFFNCILCDIRSLSVNNIIAHTQGSWHKSVALEERRKIAAKSLTKDKFSSKYSTITKKVQDDRLPISSVSVTKKISKQESNQILGRNETRGSNNQIVNFDSSTQMQLAEETLNCKICNIKLGCKQNVQEHLKGRRHLDNLRGLSTTIVSKNASESFSKVVKDSLHLNCYFCDASFLTENAFKEHFSKPSNSCLAPSFMEQIVLNGKLYFDCILCDIFSLNTNDVIAHTQGMRHKLATLAEKKRIQEEADTTYNSYSKFVTRTKCIQDICVPTSSISFTKKISEKEPNQILREGETKGSNNLISDIYSSKQKQLSTESLECKLCNVKVGNKINLEQHLNGKRHLEKTRINSVSQSDAKFCQLNLEIQNKISQKKDKNGIQDEIPKLRNAEKLSDVNIVYRCLVCNIIVGNDIELFKHLNDSKHKRILSTFPRGYTSVIYCSACECDIFGDEKMANHLITEEHRNRLLHYSRKSKDIDDNENTQKFAAESETIIEKLCIRKNIKSKKLKKNGIKKNKNSLHFSDEYSRLCLQMGPTNIFNVPQEKFERLKLSVELSFLHNDERLCFICYQRVPDNFQLLWEHLFNIDHIQKLDNLINDDKHFENYRDQYSDLTLAKEFIRELNDEIVFCVACKENINNNDDAIKKHIETDENHISNVENQRQFSQNIFTVLKENLKNNWYIVQRFWCQMCKEKFEYDLDFAKHFEKKKHLNRMQKLCSKGIEIYFDICIPCVSLSFGPPDTYTKHCEDGMHKYLVKSKDYIISDMCESAINLFKNVEKVAENLVLQSDAATSLENNNNQILELIEQTVKSDYPEAKANLFGSRACKLAFNDSDVDVFLDCGNAYNGTQLLSKIREYLLNSQKCFESQPDVWEGREVLLRAKVPIIRVNYRKLGLKCDVSFSNGLAVEKTKIVKLFMISYSPCRKMVLFLKKWLRACSETYTLGLSTFAISWLVVFYFQQIEIFPSIWELMNNKSQSKIIGDWETGFPQEIPIKHSSLTFKELLAGFFEFYASYDYRNTVISPLLGKPINKFNFINSQIDNLPIEMESYRRYLKLNQESEILRIDSPLCLQDPIELVKNITSPTSKFVLRCFIQYCWSSVEILNNSQ